MKYCNKCGNELSDSMKFCNKCGASVENSKGDSPIGITNKNKVENNNTKESTTHSNTSNKKTELQETVILDMKKDATEKLNLSKKEFKKPIKSNNSYEPVNEPKSKKKKFLIAGISILVLVGIGVSAYYLKDPMLYKYYYNSALKATSTNEKLSDYNNALKYGSNDEILNSIYMTLKSDSDFTGDSESLTNLNKDDKNKLLSKLYVFKATDDFNNDNYQECSKDLDLATKYGYNKKKFEHYDDLTKELSSNKNNNSSNIDNVYSFKNSNPAGFTGNIYDYPYNYIIPDSDSIYLSASDLSQYNKSTLALIRNEIYARHGYVFQTEPFKSYFESKSWYRPDPSFKGDDSRFNDYEIKNIQTIKSIENSK